MQLSAFQIAQLLGGTVDGDDTVMVGQLAKIEEASDGCLSFLSNPKYQPHIYTTKASVVIINDQFQPERPVQATLIRVPDAYSAFSTLLDMYTQLRLDKKGIEQPSFIHPSAQIGENVYIGAFAYIGEGAVIGDNTKIYPQTYVGDQVKIGADCMLFAGVKVYLDCVIGNRVTLHSGVVIGSDGFGFAPQKDGSYKKVAQIGNVIVEDDVEIGANTVVDCATMGSTIIRKGVKLDNLIQIAHNVEVGEHTVIAAQTGVSGSTKIGDHAVIGGQVGIVGHVKIASGSQVQAQSGLTKSIVEPNKKWAGTPAMPYIDSMRASVIYSRLPALQAQVNALEVQLQSKDKENFQ
jgi:UDP-3-O-[3-hydroxymyristoyl] glucosamine N-acyltransferase